MWQLRFVEVKTGMVVVRGWEEGGEKWRVNNQWQNVSVRQDE